MSGQLSWAHNKASCGLLTAGMAARDPQPQESYLRDSLTLLIAAGTRTANYLSKHLGRELANCTRDHKMIVQVMLDVAPRRIGVVLASSWLNWNRRSWWSTWGCLCQCQWAWTAACKWRANCGRKLLFPYPINLTLHRIRSSGMENLVLRLTKIREWGPLMSRISESRNIPERKFQGFLTGFRDPHDITPKILGFPK